ncbi:MAG TPA: hypothetical protein VF398_10900 [bacterium]
MLLVVLMAAWPALAQEAANPTVGDSMSASGPEGGPGSTPPTTGEAAAQPQASARPLWRTHTSQDEGTLIELDDVQIHGEIAQPNVAITVSRAEPLFRKIALEHVAAAGMTDLDLFRLGGRGNLPPAERIKNWKEMLNRPRQ